MIQAPRLIIAGLSGGAGKTIVTLGLCRAIANSGIAIKPFKKGPDYIDAAWLGLAAGTRACNLDPFLMPQDIVKTLFLDRMEGHEMAIIEGNRGLFDGKDVDGSLSTAELARILKTPVILVLDATKMTRTAAAIVKGINDFEPDLNLSGVILNRTAGPRHRKILEQSIENYTNVPILGMLPKLKENPIPERHMGLWSDREMHGPNPTLDTLADHIKDNVAFDEILRTARRASSLGETGLDIWPVQSTDRKPVIGVVRDAALWFYYQENIEALKHAGAEIRELSILNDEPWPELDGLYLGGGFPETHAECIANNRTIRHHIRSLSEKGLPIYAECGGFMLLAESLEYNGSSYPMCGVFPVTTELCEKPQGLGYVEAVVTEENPFHPMGETLRGHEFHYSHCMAPKAKALPLTLDITYGSGMMDKKDGLFRNNTFAGYFHLHALGTPHWAPRFVGAAAEYARNKD